MWSTGRSEAALEAALPVADRDSPAARPRGGCGCGSTRPSGTLKLTCPWRTSRRAALAWALDQRDWIEAQLARAEPGEPFEPGAMIPIEGSDVRIVWDPTRAAHAALRRWRAARAAGRRRRRRGGSSCSSSGARSRSCRARSPNYAAAAGVTRPSVSVGDAGTRWGSCSSQGRIRLSWRLILAPPEVRRFVVAHEVAHLVHLDHGAEFKALEARLFGPGLAEAKAALRRVGPRLRRVGRRR